MLYTWNEEEHTYTDMCILSEYFRNIPAIHLSKSLCKKASNHHANLPLEMYSFTL